jgi:hypothetical protein
VQVAAEGQPPSKAGQDYQISVRRRPHGRALGIRKYHP